ncbi:MAG: ThiF family adenylyltransferase [Deltaproteobacteria bacterium]|nr:ThiF family adenylyltransferase [Deltaproteobacteria bacterium]
MTATRGATVVVVGAGGSIGSQLVPHLARTPGIGRVVLVDGDRYDERNLWGQNIRRRDLGHLKVAVQRRVLREIDGTLAVDAIADVVENVPLGRMRGDVVLGAVDSKGARRSLNTIATRLGMPWIDAGVNGDQRLARVSIYRTDAAAPCHECAWDDGDYALADTERPCLAGASWTPTRAPSALGALAASLQALECRRLLAAEDAFDGAGREVVVAADTHRMVVTRFARNPDCRFDHRAFALLPLTPSVATATLADAFALARRALRGDAVELGVPGHLFATRLTCVRCRNAQSLAPHLRGRLDATALACPACGAAREVGGFDAHERLDPTQPAAVAALPLARLGLRAGDVVGATDGRTVVHFECGGDAP